MALNFNLLAQTPSIASQFAAGQDAAMQAQQMRQQMAMQQQQATISSMQLAKMQREEAAMADMQKAIAANGGPVDLSVAAEAMIRSGIPHAMDTGIKLKQTMAEHEQFRQIMGGGGPAAAPAMPTGAPAMPTGAPAMTPAPALPTPAADALRQATAPAGTPAPINALAPAAATPAPTNALATAGAVPTNQDQRMEMKRRRDALLALGTPQALKAAEALGSDIVALERQHALPPETTLVGSSGEVIAQTAKKQELPTELVRNYEYAKRQGYKGSLFDYEREMKLAARTPAQPPAATVTQIQNPANPNEMITIDARTYKGGGVGSPGVLGLAGKTPAATAKQDAIDKGQAQVQAVIDDLRTSYRQLKGAKAIPSTEEGVLSNLAASTQASDLGQFLGRTAGTQEQSARDTIKSSRLMLLNGIQRATGMSSQQLNSNVELQTWLNAVSDPKQAVETTDKILANIEKFIATGGKYSAKNESAKPAAQAKPSGGAAAAAPKTPSSTATDATVSNW